ncbi:MAG: type I secretion system permease/ATPase, partial [Magnetococcales bacterium]|nr:type I secretion system permease/ATPase [Magnetococcales bacterium]
MEQQKERLGLGQTLTAAPTPIVDPGLACVELICRFHQIPFNREGLKRRYGGEEAPFTNLEILRAFKTLGFKAREVHPNWRRIDKISLPAIAPLKNGGYCIIGQANQDQVLVLSPLAQRSQKISKNEFDKKWTGELILAVHRESKTKDQSKFDFTWFIPAVLKYKKLFGEVLIAAFFLQIFALVTPLFFQVVIDKVLVHNGVTTLDVLAIGMLTIALFEVILGGLKTYLLSHTTNRIDVELGAKLYTHLVSLPLAWFGVRR